MKVYESQMTFLFPFSLQCDQFQMRRCLHPVRQARARRWPRRRWNASEGLGNDEVSHITWEGAPVEIWGNRCSKGPSFMVQKRLSKTNNMMQQVIAYQSVICFVELYNSLHVLFLKMTKNSWTYMLLHFFVTPQRRSPLSIQLFWRLKLLPVFVPFLRDKKIACDAIFNYPHPHPYELPYWQKERKKECTAPSNEEACSPFTAPHTVLLLETQTQYPASSIPDLCWITFQIQIIKTFAVLLKKERHSTWGSVHLRGTYLTVFHSPALLVLLAPGKLAPRILSFSNMYANRTLWNNLFLYFIIIILFFFYSKKYPAGVMCVVCGGAAATTSPLMDKSKLIRCSVMLPAAVRVQLCTLVIEDS